MKPRCHCIRYSSNYFLQYIDRAIDTLWKGQASTYYSTAWFFCNKLFVLDCIKRVENYNPNQWSQQFRREEWVLSAIPYNLCYIVVELKIKKGDDICDDKPSINCSQLFLPFNYPNKLSKFCELSLLSRFVIRHRGPDSIRIKWMKEDHWYEWSQKRKRRFFWRHDSLRVQAR